MKIEEKNKNSKKKFNVLHATSIEYINRKQVQITEDDIKAFNKFVAYPKLLNRLAFMYAPNIIGNENIKHGLLRAIVGGVNRDKLSSGRIDTLTVGDPGTAKSELGTEATELKPNSRHVSAPHGTTRTITAIPEKVNEIVSLRLGAIPLSAYGICAIDEINSWSMEDQGLLLEIIQNSYFDFDKMGIRRRIPAPTTIIATLNPIGGRWDNPKVATPEELHMKVSVVDRFSQVFTTRDNMNEEQIKDFVTKMDKINKRRPYNYNFLRKYLIHASSIKDVTFTKDARGLLNKYWEEGKIKQSLSIRSYKNLYKIAEAQAKLQLKNVVDLEIARQTIVDFDDMRRQYDKAVGEILGPQDISYKLCVEILQESDAGMTIEELCRVVVHKDNQVLNYLGYIWSREHNRKVRDLIDSLLNHHNIKKINNHPIILQWVPDLTDLTDKKTLSEVSPVDDNTDLTDLTDKKTDKKVHDNKENEKLTSEFLSVTSVGSGASDRSHSDIEKVQCAICKEWDQSYWIVRHNHEREGE